MRVQRIITKQGHPVPQTAHSPKGPFPPELMREPEIITDYIPFDDDIPIGGTVQNKFTEPKKFRCRYCGEIMYQHKIPDHVCEGIDNGTNP